MQKKKKKGISGLQSGEEFSGNLQQMWRKNWNLYFRNEK